MTDIVFGEITELPLPKEKQPNSKQSSYLSLEEESLFSLYIFRAGLDKIENHLKENPKIECGGLILGHPFVDLDNPKKKFTIIVGSVPVLSTNSSIGHYTVGPEELIKARLKIPEGLISVGWYHSHPGHGIFLSNADMTIVKSIYNLDWHVAFVFDTFSGDKGFFYGGKGKRIKDVDYLNQKPIIIEAIIRYNCAVTAKEEGDESVMESFKNWICKSPSDELSHWIQSGMYQDIPIDKTSPLIHDISNWNKELNQAVSYFEAGKIYSAQSIFERLAEVKKDTKVLNYLRRISNIKKVY